MLNRLRKLLGKATEGRSLHAPFHVTTHHGHIVQTFLSLEAALEAAASLGPDHYVIDRHGFPQPWPSLSAPLIISCMASSAAFRLPASVMMSLPL